MTCYDLSSVMIFFYFLLSYYKTVNPTGFTISQSAIGQWLYLPGKLRNKNGNFVSNKCGISSSKLGTVKRNICENDLVAGKCVKHTFALLIQVFHQ